MRCTAIRDFAARCVFAFVLGAAAPASAQAPAAPAGNAESGRKLYVDRACWQCHGLVAQGGGIAGPRLAGRVEVWAAFSSYVRRPTEEMIPYTAQVLPDDELADIFEWLRTLPPPPPVESLPLLSPPP
jgi:ubiquinol-cytochrome c reductase cytochrome c subunit